MEVALRTQLSEKRFTTHDGRIWPVDRIRMQSAEDIRRRMVEDIGTLYREAGSGEFISVSMDDLREKGWSPQQIRQHGFTAWNLFGAQRSAKAKVMRASELRREQDRPHRIVADAAAVILVIGAISVWSGHLTSAI